MCTTGTTTTILYYYHHSDEFRIQTHTRNRARGLEAVSFNMQSFWGHAFKFQLSIFALKCIVTFCIGTRTSKSLVGYSWKKGNFPSLSNSQPSCNKNCSPRKNLHSSSQCSITVNGNECTWFFIKSIIHLVIAAMEHTLATRKQGYNFSWEYNLGKSYEIFNEISKWKILTNNLRI